MRVLGYENETEGRKLIYRPRDHFFVREGDPAVTIQYEELADLQTEANDEYAYTSVEIGYEKQDYESVNGRFEANGTFEYATGYVRRRESKLTLASPYRADSIGIELLCWERNKRSTDNKADNDIFFVALKKTGELYQTYMDIFLQEEGVKMFNAPYHPYFLALANRSLIAINAPKITFASTDMSSKTTISSGEHLFADIQTGQKLFEPVVYNFASGNFVDLPDAHRCNGLVRFNWQGVWLDGFIKKIAKNYSLETETTWELWKVK